MTVYAPIGSLVEAVQWNKNGDHHAVFNMNDGGICAICKVSFKYHGMIYRDSWKKQRTVCPGSYIIKMDDGQYKAIPQARFESEYEKITG